MKKQKMTADNVEQLMEIVRALQTGEDPAEALNRKKTESAPKADSPKSNSGKDNLHKASSRKDSSEKKKAESTETQGEAEPQKKKPAVQQILSGRTVKKKEKREAVGSDDFFEDEFERNLMEDNKAKLEKPDVNAALDRVSECLWNVVQGIDRIVDSAAKGTQKRRKKAAKPKASSETKSIAPAGKLNANKDSDVAEIPVEPEISAKSEMPVKPEMSVESEVPVKMETSSASELSESLETVVPAKMTENGSGPDEKPDDAVAASTSDGQDAERQMETEEKTDPAAKQETDHQEQAAAEDRKILERILESSAAVGQETDGSNTENPAVQAKIADDNRDVEPAAQTSDADKENRRSRRKLPASRSLKGAAGDLNKTLGEKGIGRREIIMILLVAVLAIVIVALITNGIRGSLEEKRKSEHVTADKGLTVTVEREPEQWCSSYEVQLRFRTPRMPVTKVTINGMALQPDAKGYVTFVTSDYLLEAEAATENGILKATIEIPKLDSQSPMVSASKEQDQITLVGADARSAVSAIRYAIVRSDDPIQLPRYQEYNGTIPFEADVLYYFYAEDAAGNRSDPVVTNMETAESIAFSQDMLTMYPDETVYLKLQATPEGALLNNLRYENMNPDIISVAADGAVTALKEGTAVVRASADGVEIATCMIEVSSTRTVTISTIGDCTLGADASFNTTTSLDAFAVVNGKSYFFENVRDILENDDITFANLECVLTTETTRENRTYAFKGDPSYTEILQDGSVEVVTLANNHNADYGAQSHEDTKQYLTGAGISYCYDDTYVIREVNGVKTAFVGFYALRDGMAIETQVRETIAAAKADGAQLVIAAFHWGSEKATQPDETQKSLAHIAVDCGADLVVGHHPHVLQGIEKYNGKYIVYSLANFCFGGNTAPSDKDTMIFRQTFTISEGVVQDDDQIEIVPCSVSSVSDYNNYQPTPATGAEADRIMGRINEYSAEFGQTFSASEGQEPEA